MDDVRDFYEGEPLDVNFGWVDDPRRHIHAADLPVYGDLAPYLASEPTKPILLYKAWKDVLKSYPSYLAQLIGDCTSFGNGHADDLRQCVEIVLGEPSEYQEVCTEALYGAGREVAGMLHSWGDGCYGSAIMKAATQIGLVPRKLVGPYSGQRAKQWGNSGIPAEIRAECAKYKLPATAKIVTRQDAISALWNGMPFAICSNRGFTMVRDAKGKCQPRGAWGHCMMVAAFDPAENTYLICNSWGDTAFSGPLYLDQPAFSFWADASVVERDILGAGDSWAWLSAPDFASRRVLPEDWTRA